MNSCSSSLTCSPGNSTASAGVLAPPHPQQAAARSRWTTVLLVACSAAARCLSAVKSLACLLGGLSLNEESHRSQYVKVARGLSIQQELSQPTILHKFAGHSLVNQARCLSLLACSSLASLSWLWFCSARASFSATGQFQMWTFHFALNATFSSGFCYGMCWNNAKWTSGGWLEPRQGI